MSSLFIDAFVVDTEDSEHGRWVTLLSRGDFKLRIKIRRTSSKKFQEAKNAFMEPHREALSLGILEPEIYESVLKRAAAKALILDWEGIKVEDSDTEDIKFTPERALHYFNEFPDFFNLVYDAANSKDNFIVKDIEKAKALLKKN